MYAFTNCNDHHVVDCLIVISIVEDMCLYVCV